MSYGEASSQTYIGTVDDLPKRYSVFCRVAFDGVEQVGRLWFVELGEQGEPGPPESAVPDRAPIPGRTREEVLERVRGFTPDELGMRLQRAMTDKRRNLRLRRATDELLAKVRYMNQVAIAASAGLLDDAGARQEMELIEQQLHEFVDGLRHNVGVIG